MPGEKVHKEGRWAVLRDSKGEIVDRITDRGSERENWRQFLRRRTDNGRIQFEEIIKIGSGEPFVPKLQDGREGEPMVAPMSVRLEANKFLVEMMHGKAVAQTEMRKAEEETQLVDKFRALSDEELHAKVLDALQRRQLPVGESTGVVLSETVSTSNTSEPEDGGGED